ncbi:MAG: cupin domain-containing protein [Chloroflexota bacterium]
MSGDTKAPASGPISRRRLHGAAFGAAAALAATRGAGAWPGVPAHAPSVAADPDAFFLAFSSLPPKEFAAGVARFARTETMPALEGLSLAAITMTADSVREVHWHDNADELTWVRSGSGVAIMLWNGTRTVMPLEPGSLIYLPKGSAHAIWSTGEDPMELLLGFNNPNPETIEFSTSLPFVPVQVLAQAGGVAPGDVPFLPRVPEAFAAPLAGDPPAATSDASRFSTRLQDVAVETFAGGTRRLADAEDIPALDGIKFTEITLEPGASRLPHWHPAMNEVICCVAGTVQVGVIGSGDEEQTAVLRPGDVGFVPVSWLHYLANVGEEEATLVLYHDAVPIGFIELADVLAAFPPDLLAASFGIDGAAFASMGQGPSPIIAGPAAGTGA